MRAQGQPQAVKFTLPQVPKIAIYIVGFIPAVWLFYEGINDRLGADPMRYLEQSLGLWALRFLIATLAITPLRQLLKINLLRYRRGLGLLTFYYACLHLLTYLVLDQGLDVAAIVADIVKRPYITIGMATFIILIPLAVTSNNASVRKLGGHAWARLHRLVYLAAIGVYAAIVAALLGYRLLRSLIKKPQPRRRAA
jgi:sulfoxide reductase heme-binding subunit YedZ